MAEMKEPFMSQDDLASMTIDPDKPIAELRVRDLQSILAGTSATLRPSPSSNVAVIGNKPLKDFFDKPFPEKWPPIEILRLESIQGSMTFQGNAGFDQLVQTISNLAAKVDEIGNKVSDLERQMRK